MSKLKITLGRLPDFKLPVKIVMPNGDDGEVIFTVRHLKIDEIQEIYNSESIKNDVEMIMHLATGWDLEDEFNAENVKELVSLFPAISIQIFKSYMGAAIGQRAKN